MTKDTQIITNIFVNGCKERYMSGYGLLRYKGRYRYYTSDLICTSCTYVNQYMYYRVVNKNTRQKKQKFKTKLHPLCKKCNTLFLKGKEVIIVYNG